LRVTFKIHVLVSLVVRAILLLVGSTATLHLSALRIRRVRAVRKSRLEGVGVWVSFRLLWRRLPLDGSGGVLDGFASEGDGRGLFLFASKGGRSSIDRA
jgi:hypothetical protein